MMFTAIALDPGGTTGWATYQALRMDSSADVWTSEWYDEKWNCGQLTGNHEEDLDILLGTYHTQEYHVICERFTPRPGKIGAKLDSAPKYITLTEKFVRDRNNDGKDHYGHPVRLCMQNVAQVKPFVKDRNIRKLGLWTPGQRHAMDAMRHLLFWLIHGPYRRTDLLEKGWKFE